SSRRVLTARSTSQIPSASPYHATEDSQNAARSTLDDAEGSVNNGWLNPIGLRRLGYLFNAERFIPIISALRIMNASARRPLAAAARQSLGNRRARAIP